MSAGPARPGVEAAVGRVLWAVGIGAFLGSITGSGVPIALPDLGRDLGLGLSGTSQVMLAYFLGASVLLVIAGRLGDWLGHRAVYNMGALLLVAGSLATASAQGLPLLVAGRLVQGVAGAFLMAVGPALLTAVIAPERRGRAFGALSTATYLGLSAGPPLGGALVAAFGWRAVFLVMAGVGVLLYVLGTAWLPRRAERGARMTDGAGALLMLTGFPLVVIALSRGHEWGWGAPATLGCAGLGGALFLVFLRVERGRAGALVDLRLFRSRVFSGAALAALFNYIGLFFAFLLMPYYLREGLGLAPAHAGAVLSAQPIVMAIVAFNAGALSDRIGTRGLAVTGMLILAGGLLGLSSLGPASPVWAVVGWYTVCGLGTGMFVSPNTSALMGAAPRDQQGLAGGVLALARTFGMLLGIAAATTVFETVGGRTGGYWNAIEYDSLRVALWIAAGHAVVGALTSAWRGRPATAETAPG